VFLGSEGFAERHCATTKPLERLREVPRAAPELEMRTRLHYSRTEVLNPLQQPDHPIQAVDVATRADLAQVAGDCVDLCQRSSCAVEGRNDQLLRCNHGRHRLSDRKRAALTAVHNFHIRRADGNPCRASLRLRAAEPHSIAQ
jgi:hypothetical protein